MTLPISERAMQAVMAQLQTITMANGYNTDVGSAMFRERISFEIEDLPAGSVFETSEAPAGGSATDNNASMLIGHGFAVELHGNPNAEDVGVWIGLARADVKQCLCGWAAGLTNEPGRGVRDVDGEIGILLYIGSDRIVRPDGGITSSVNVRFAVTYKEGFGDPYAAL
jgi:hypothetical protein